MPTERGNREDGFALLLVLVLTAILIAVGTFALRQARIGLLMARQARATGQLYYTAEAGLERAIADVENDPSFERVISGPRGPLKTGASTPFPPGQNGPHVFPASPFRYQVEVERVAEDRADIVSRATADGTGTRIVSASVTRLRAVLLPAALCLRGPQPFVALGRNFRVVAKQGDLAAIAVPTDAGASALRTKLGAVTRQLVVREGRAPIVSGVCPDTAAWYERESKGIEYPFPKLFGRLGDEYDKRFGLKDEHLAHISAVNYSNAKRNPNAQTRNWFMSESHASHPSKYNTVIGGRIKVSDCSQITDGAAVIFLASAEYAQQYAKRNGLELSDIPRILGWGHRTARIEFDAKVAESRDNPYVLPHTRGAILDAFRRAGIGSVDELSGIETHDCFTTSEYMAIDHFGLTKPGESWKAIEEGVIEMGGRMPINPSGGLIGTGHPVGATGVRQMLDAYKQVTGTAGDYQVEDAKRFAILNIGGSATTSCAFVVGK